MLEADEHEIRGDAAGALRVIEGMPVDSMGRRFWRPEREHRLRQLVALADAAPAWVFDRWVVAQAAQSTPGDPHRAIDEAVRTRGGASTLWGVDEIDAQAKVIDHDWVYRQLVLYEYGGLATFVRKRASSPLLARATGVATWVGTAMGAYELVDETADQLTWREVGSGRRVDTLNLGGAMLCLPGSHVIGRVVASEGCRSSRARHFPSRPTPPRRSQPHRPTGLPRWPGRVGVPSVQSSASSSRRCTTSTCCATCLASYAAT